MGLCCETETLHVATLVWARNNRLFFCTLLNMHQIKQQTTKHIVNNSEGHFIQCLLSQLRQPWSPCTRRKDFGSCGYTLGLSFIFLPVNPFTISVELCTLPHAQVPSVSWLLLEKWGCQPMQMRFQCPHRGHWVVCPVLSKRTANFRNELAPAGSEGWIRE